MRSVSRLAVFTAALLVGAATIVASEESVRLARVVERPEDLATLFADAQTFVTYDSASGRFYYPSLGMYFDPVTSLFFDPETGKYKDYALHGSYSSPMTDGMYYDASTGLYYDAEKLMTYNAQTQLYHDDVSGLDLSWDERLGEFYDPVAEMYYDMGLGIHLSYDSQKQMFYDANVLMFYDPELGLYYDAQEGYFYDPYRDLYYDRDAGQYYNPSTGSVSADPGGHLVYDEYYGQYYFDIDGRYYTPTDDGLYVCYGGMCGDLYLDPDTGAHLLWDGMREIYRVEETSDLYDGMSRCYYDTYNNVHYKFDAASGSFVDATSGMFYRPYWMEMGYASLPLLSEAVVDVSNMQYDDTMGMYYDMRTRMWYNEDVGLYYDGMSYYDQYGTGYWYDSMQNIYFNCVTGEEHRPLNKDSQGSVDMSNMYYDSMMDMYYDNSRGMYYDDKIGLYYDGMNYYDHYWNCYWYDCMFNKYINCSTGEVYCRESQISPNRNRVDMSNMYYDSMMGMYYDMCRGMYYDDLVGLYYDGMNYYDVDGNCYWYDSMQDKYVDYSTGECYSASGALSECQIDQIKRSFMDLAYKLAYGNDVDEENMCPDPELVKIQRTYYVAPFGASDAVWFDRLFRLGTDYGSKKIRIARGVMPLTLTVEWTDAGYMMGTCFQPCDLTIAVSQKVWDRAVNAVEVSLSITWSTMYIGSYFWNGNSMFYYSMDGQGIEGVDSQDDFDAYALYSGDSYYGELFSSAVYRGCWQSPWYAVSNYSIMDYSPVEHKTTLGGLIDTDGDGVADVDEYVNGTNLFMSDTDGDGMNDGLELRIGSNPCVYDEDADGDGMADVWEDYFGLNPENAVDANADPDRDGLKNFEEYSLGTNPISADTDGDGLRDGDELKHGTQPCNPDTDNDGVHDGLEMALGMNPHANDSDEDGLTDGQEMYLGTSSTNVDTDGDGLSDYDEFIRGTNPCLRDSDHDGIDDAMELRYESDPLEPVSLSPWIMDCYVFPYFIRSADEARPLALEWGSRHYIYLNRDFDIAFMRTIDSDGDFLSDWCEFLMGTDPLNADTDLDGIEDGLEVDGGDGPDPLNPDTDGDGLLDGEELQYGTNPLKECSRLVGLKDGFAIRFDGCDGPYAVMSDGRTAYEHVLYTGDVHGEIDDNSAFGSGKARVTFLVKSYVGNPATLHVGDLEIPLLPNAEIPIKVKVPVGEDVEVYYDFQHWEYGDWEAEDRYRSQLGSSFDYYNEKVEFTVVDANEFTVLRNDYWHPGDDSCQLLASYQFPESPLCIHDKEKRELYKSFEDVLVDTYTGDGVVCNWELVENTKDVEFADMSYNSYSVGVHVKASFPDSERRHCRLTYQHPNYVAGPTSKILEVRYCPEFHNPELSEEVANNKIGDNDCRDSDARCTGVRTLEKEVYEYSDVCPLTNETSSTEMAIVVAPDQLTLRKYKNNKLEYFVDKVLLPFRIIDQAQVKYDEFGEAPKGQCCPCPDHAHNHVDIFASSRVELFGENFSEGTDSIVNFPDTIYTVGKRPSCSIEDALVLFTTNGAEYVKHYYTVLGVNIEVPNVDLDYFNKLSDDLGMPMLVGTNVLSSVLRESDGAPSHVLRSAPLLDLKCNVGLNSGIVRLSLSDVAGHFKVVAIGKNNDVTILMDTVQGCQKQWKLEDWWKLVDSEAKIRLVAVTRGSCKVHFSYGTVRDGKLYRDAVSQRFTAVYPLILPDYNRDGRIDDDDAYSYQNGRMYYFWENDDTWEDNNPNAAITFVSNGTFSKVDGRYDVINLTPFAVCVKPFCSTLGIDEYSYELAFANSQHDPALRYVPVELSWSDVNAVHRIDQMTCEKNQQNLHDANLIEVVSKDEGKSRSVLSQQFLSVINKSTDDLGCIVAEFPRVFTNDITLVVRKTDSQEIVSRINLPTTIVNPFNMMRWVNIRHLDSGMSEKRQTRLTVDWPDSEHANANVIFVHGFNVNEDESVAWAKSIFKKFWWSGLDAGFTAVSWPSSIGQISIPLLNQPNVTYKYYQNIMNAYTSAEILPFELKDVPGEHYIMAHSLGNMLVSISRQDHHLQYKQFFMMNAAVAIETYDGSNAVYNMYDSRFKTTALRGMTNSDWWGLDPVFRCNHWYELFPENDGRHGLTWKNRFKDVDNTVNYYSTEDEVLMNGDGRHQRIGTRDHIWYNQEHLKGRALGLATSAGWNFRPGLFGLFMKTHEAMNKKYRENPEKMKCELRRRPYFEDFKYKEFQGDNGSAEAANYLKRAESLSFEIPAESFAVGANPVPKWGNSVQKGKKDKQRSRNVNMAKINGSIDFDCFDRTLFQRCFGTPPPNRWAHAYFATMPYQSVFKVFEDIVPRVNQKETLGSN